MRSLALIAFLFWMLPAAARVVDLHTEIRVAKSGELMVTERMALLASQNLVAVLQGDPCDHILNPEALEVPRND